MVTKMLEQAIEIEGLLRIIRDGNPLPETYTLLSHKAVELADAAMLLEENSASEPQPIKSQQPSAIGQRSSDKSQEPSVNDGASENGDVSMILLTNEPTESIMREEEKPRQEPEIVITEISVAEKDEDIRENSQYENVHGELSETEEEAINLYDTSSSTEEEEPELKLNSSKKEEETDDTEKTTPSAVEEDDDILLTIEEESPDHQASEPQQQEAPKPTFKRPVKLKSAFSLNDRFLYSRELFDGDMKMFDSTLDFIEGIEEFSIIEDYFYSELEWDPENMAVASFMEILRPHFQE